MLTALMQAVDAEQIANTHEDDRQLVVLLRKWAQPRCECLVPVKEYISKCHVNQSIVKKSAKGRNQCNVPTLIFHDFKKQMHGTAVVTG